MDLTSYAHLLLRRWRIVVVTTLVAVGLAALGTMLSPKSYASGVEFFVSTSGGADATATQLVQGSTFSQARVKSYSQLVKTPKLLEPVIADLRLDTTAGELAGRVSATIPPDTVLIDVTVTDGDAARARDIAASISEHFPKMVTDLERLSSTDASPVKVTQVQTPLLSTTPVSPKPVRNVLLGVVLGLLLGVGLAVLRDTLDTKIRTREDVEQSVDAVIVGAIPFDKDAPSHPLILQADPNGGRAEAFKSLRTNLRFLDPTDHPRSIVITSSVPAEGKSTTSANLALALAEGGSHVCVIEGDLRRPRLLEQFGVTEAVGLTDVLIGRAQLADVLQPFGQHRLSLLGAGATAPNPSELLGSEAMRAMLRQLESIFDYVVVDAPPLLAVTDAAVLAAQVDGAILVIGSGMVNPDQARQSADSLAAVQAKVLGVVLNKFHRENRRSGYYGYYGQQPAPQRPAPTRSLRQPQTTRRHG